MKFMKPGLNDDKIFENKKMSHAHLREQKDESRAALEGGNQPNMPNRPPVEKTAPVKSQKIMGRNERVTVQYTNGTVKKDVKFKTIEEDLRNWECVLLDQ